MKSGRSRFLPYLASALLAAGLPGVDGASLLGAAAIALVLLSLLRLREARDPAGRRQVALLQLLTAGLLAALQPELGPSLLQLAATVTALAGLLSLELSDGAGARLLLRRSLALLAASLPMALLLFLLLPRLGPLLPVTGGRGEMAATGLSEQLDPGRIAELAGNNAPAARLSWRNGSPPPAAERYWRVLVHSTFDGQRWSHRREPAITGATTASAPTASAPSTSASNSSGSQFWLVEASGLSAVPWAGSGLPQGSSLVQLGAGELHDARPSDQRRAYTVFATDQPPSWPQQPPIASELALPRSSNPRLEQLAAQWRRQGSPQRRLQLAEAWFRSQPFRYSTSPGQLPQQAGLDAFLFERQQGFCGHYASAFSALMRAAGVPARVVSGYLGGVWVQPLGGNGYLDLRQGDAHAWSEVWLPGQGWQRVDPTAWVAPERRQASPLAALQAQPTALLWLQRQWWALELGWSGWWQGFDRQGQEALLQRLLGDRRHWLGPLLLAGLGLGLGGGVLLLRSRPAQQARQAPRRELDALLRALQQQGMETGQGDTLSLLAERLSRQRPELAGAFETFSHHYRQLRFSAHANSNLAALRTSRRQLLRQLRRGQTP
ncbi:MAG: transglutaminaseTgpA domain-containing protein [Prochlorococcaceae cyanobacterium]